MNRNTGIKVTLVILVIICLIQAGMLSSLNSLVEGLDGRLTNVEMRARNTEMLLAELEAEQAENNLGEYSFDIKGADVAMGTVEFEFSVTPRNMTDNTKVLVSNTIDTVELTKSGNSFAGVLNYPMDSETYETVYYVYDGDNERGSELIDWIGAGNWVEKVAIAEFYGMTSYGNGKLTLAGDINYYLYSEDEVKSSRLVFMDNSIELSGKNEDVVEINFSETIDVDSEGYFKELYLEFEMESGYIYQIYPLIGTELTYELQGDGVDKSTYIYQNSELDVKIDENTIYKMTF